MAARSTSGLLVARDLEIVAWLDRLAAASVDQIRSRFGLGRTQAYRRLQVLRDFGLVRRRHLTLTRPPLYTVTGRRLRVASCEHAHALSDLVVRIEAAGGEVATELELRRERANGLDPGRLSEEQRATVLACRRIPDAAELLPDGRLRAYEVELQLQGSHPTLSGSRGLRRFDLRAGQMDRPGSPARGADPPRDRRDRDERISGGVQWQPAVGLIGSARTRSARSSAWWARRSSPSTASLRFSSPRSGFSRVRAVRRRSRIRRERRRWRATGWWLIGAGLAVGAAYFALFSVIGADAQWRRFDRKWGFGHLDASALAEHPWAWLPIGAALAIVAAGATILWRTR